MSHVDFDSTIQNSLENFLKAITNEAIEIVKQEAERYNNGWIPCSEKLPDVRQDVLVTVKYTGFMGMHGYWIKTGHMEAENDWWEIAQAVKSLHGNHYQNHLRSMIE